MSNKISAKKLLQHGVKKGKCSITFGKKMEVIRRMGDG